MLKTYTTFTRNGSPVESLSRHEETDLAAERSCSVPKGSEWCCPGGRMVQMEVKSLQHDNSYKRKEFCKYGVDLHQSSNWAVALLYSASTGNFL